MLLKETFNITSGSLFAKVMEDFNKSEYTKRVN